MEVKFLENKNLQKKIFSQIYKKKKLQKILEFFFYLEFMFLTHTITQARKASSQFFFRQCLGTLSPCTTQANWEALRERLVNNMCIVRLRIMFRCLMKPRKNPLNRLDLR